MRLTAQQFASSVIAAGLSSADEIKALWGAIPAAERPKDGEALSKLLIERGALTQFQARELLSDSQTPLVLGDYVLLAKIGAGGMGQVFKAQHRHMKRLVAIKLLPAALTKDEAAVKRFRREVEAAAKLSHPNIVHANDASVQRGVWYLVMEHVEGHDLSHVVATEGPLPIARAVDYICQTARGLAFAHENGVVHRDIKPANLLLDKKGVVRILDMGLARFDDAMLGAHDGLTQSGQVMGTIDYMAPEQAFSMRTADSRADIYSLGCTLYRLLTGANLFEAETIVQKLMTHQTAAVPALSQLRPDAPRGLDAIFQKMVAKRPEDRYQTMSEVDVALTALLAGLSSPGSAADGSSGGGQPVKLSRSVTGATGHPQTEAGGATALLHDELLANAADGNSPTVTLSGPLQGTHEVSARSVQMAENQLPVPGRAPNLPPWRRPPVLIAAGFGGILLIALALWVIVRDKDGKEVARDPVPEGGKAEVVDETPVAPPPAPPSALLPVRKSDWPFDPADGREYVWSDPVNLGTEINTRDGEMVWGISDDERTIYFDRSIARQFMTARRETKDAPFQSPTVLLRDLDWTGGISSDGLVVVCSKIIKGKEGNENKGRDLYLAQRSSSDQAFGEPEPMPAPVNGVGQNLHPMLSPDGLTLLASSTRKGSNWCDVWMFTRPSREQAFTEVQQLPPPINTSGWDIPAFINNDHTLLIRGRAARHARRAGAHFSLRHS